jgi:hypothetical protein
LTFAVILCESHSDCDSDSDSVLGQSILELFDMMYETFYR